jgi:hypothetical protein
MRPLSQSQHYPATCAETRQLAIGQFIDTIFILVPRICGCGGALTDHRDAPCANMRTPGCRCSPNRFRRLSLGQPRGKVNTPTDMGPLCLILTSRCTSSTPPLLYCTTAHALVVVIHFACPCLFCPPPLSFD